MSRNFQRCVRLSLALQFKLQTSFRWRARAFAVFAFEGFCVHSFAVAAIIATRCKGYAFFLRSLLLFARGCACVRLHAVWGCFCAGCTAFSAFAILCPHCTLSRVLWLVLQPRLLQPLLCALRAEIQRPGGAKVEEQQGEKSPRLRGCVL